MASHPDSHHYDIILLGKTGVGKSASGNTLLGEKLFISKKRAKAVTERIQKESVTFDGVTLDVYDTPGLLDPETKEEKDRSELEDLLSRSSCPVILLVMKADGVSEEDKQVVDLIENLIRERFFQNTWILFTRGDELERENLSTEEFIEDADELKEIVQRFGNRYHVFNNFSESPEQVRMLIQKIKETPQIISPDSIVGSPHPHTRIVLVGNTAAGKSATGNTILGESRFRSKISSSTVTSKSEMQEVDFSGRKISVIDTPGLFDTKLTNKKIAKEVGRSIYLSQPGPHAFLYVQPLITWFTKQEENMQKLEQLFGEKLSKYTIVVFTFGELVEGESVDQLMEENSSLKQLIEQCGGRYHIMSNRQRKKQQVTELLEKIDRMIEENGGAHYTTEMYEKAQGFQTFKEFFTECRNSLFLAAGVTCEGGASIGAVGGLAGAAIGAAIDTVVGLAGGIGAGIHRQKSRKESQSEEQNGDEEGSAPDTDDPGNSPESKNDLLCKRSSTTRKQLARSIRMKMSR